MANDRHFERYFEIGQRWLSPEELDELRKGLGSPAEILDRHARLEQLLAKAERREAVWQFLKAAAIGFAAIMAALATAKGLLPDGWLW